MSLKSRGVQPPQPPPCLHLCTPKQKPQKVLWRISKTHFSESRVCFRCGSLAGQTLWPARLQVWCVYIPAPCCTQATARCSAVPIMLKQLVTFSLLWGFVLFLAPLPALGNFNSGDCTIGDSPGKTVRVCISPTST